MEEKYRCRNFLLLLYPEDSTHAEAISKLESGGYQYAAILHDKDVWTADDPEFNPDKHVAGEVKKEHVHVVLKFQNPRWDTALAKELGIKRNYIQECKNLDDRLLYLVHVKYPEKYQYESTEVFGPLRPSLEKLLADETEDARMLKILDLVESTAGKISARSLLRTLGNNGLYGEARRMGYLLKWLIDEHNYEAGEAVNAEMARLLNREKFGDFCAFTGDKDVQPLGDGE